MSANYYQLVKPTGDDEEIFRKTSERELYPTRFNTTIRGNFFALKISPSKLNIFDASVKDLKMNYLLFANIDFENLIKSAKQLEINIREIRTIATEEDLQEELEKYLLKKDYEALLKFIDENSITIKELEFSYDNAIIRVYDSGIIWSDSDLSKTTKLTHLIESILELVE